MNLARIAVLGIAAAVLPPLTTPAFAEEETLQAQNDLCDSLFDELRATNQSAEAQTFRKWWRRYRKQGRLDANLACGIREHLDALSDARRELDDARAAVADAAAEVRRLLDAGKDAKAAREHHAVHQSLLASFEAGLADLVKRTPGLARAVRHRSDRFGPYTVTRTTSVRADMYTTSVRSLLRAGMTRDDILRRVQKEAPNARFITDGSDLLVLLDASELEKARFRVALANLSAQAQLEADGRLVERTALEHKIADERLASLDAAHAALEAEAKSIADSGDTAKLARINAKITDNLNRFAQDEATLRDLQGTVVDRKGVPVARARLLNEGPHSDLTAYAGRRTAIDDIERRRLESRLTSLEAARAALLEAGLTNSASEVETEIARMNADLTKAQAASAGRDATLDAVNALRKEVAALRNDVRDLRRLVQQLLDRR